MSAIMLLINIWVRSLATRIKMRKMKINSLAIISSLKRSNLKNKQKEEYVIVNNTIFKKVNPKFYLN